MKDSATVSIDVRELCGETAKIPERPGYVAQVHEMAEQGKMEINEPS